jgi:hypothetical protein
MQATTFDVSNKLTLAHTDTDTDSISTTYDCNVEVQLAGDSIWDCEIAAVTVTSIHIHESFDEDGDSSIHITVCYNVDGDTEYEGSWRLYTDTGFTEAISALLGTSVSFTEQGMQDDGYASMEL